MLACLSGIGEGVLDYDGLVAAHTAFNEVFVRLVVVRVFVEVFEEFVSGVSQVHTHIAAEDQTLDRLEFEEDVTHPALGLVGRMAVLNHRERVGHILEIGCRAYLP